MHWPCRVVEVVFGILSGRAALSFGMCYENVLEVVVDFGQSYQVKATLADYMYVLFSSIGSPRHEDPKSSHFSACGVP